MPEVFFLLAFFTQPAIFSPISHSKYFDPNLTQNCHYSHSKAKKFRLRALVIEGDSLVIEGDSLVIEGDSLAIEGDSLVVEGDSLAIEGDSLVIEGDSLVIEGDSLGIEGDSLVIEGDTTQGMHVYCLFGL